MSIDLKMPALSPTMEEGTLARWLVKEGDTVKSGDIIAEIETDKATMEFEAIDDGVVARIVVAEGSDNVKVGTVIAVIAGDDDVPTASASPAAAPAAAPASALFAAAPSPVPAPVGRIKASPLARRIAHQNGVDLSAVTGSGPAGRIVKADVIGVRAAPVTPKADVPVATAPAVPAPLVAAPAPVAAPVMASSDIPHDIVKLSNMRKTIARRLTEAKQTVPHIYLTVDIRLDRLLKLRGELNAALAPQGVKLSVNDLLIKALAKALIAVPQCNVSFAGDQLIQYHRADISVAVSVPAGLITPIITGADTKAIGAISTEMKALAERAKDGKLQPHEYQGGTASLSNMGMFGIRQFDAVINPPQGMILAIGAGEKRPAVIDDALQVATIMSATGSFDHRAIDGADGARLMQALREMVEAPLAMLA